MNLDPGAAFNPWLSIWTKPRETIQKIVETDPGKHVTALAAIAGVVHVLGEASSRDLGDRVGLVMILAMALLVGSIGGVIGLYLSAVLLRWTGKWIGGRASTTHLRAAVAWAYVPIIAWGVLWVPVLVMLGREAFASYTPRLNQSTALTLMLLAFGLAQVAAAVWTAIVMCKAIGQVQGFSAWRGLLNCVLPGIVIGVPLIVLAVILGVLGR